MKKLILIATAVLFALSVGGAFAADAPADKLIDSGNGDKPGVMFSHAKHKAAVEKCETCHHKGVDPKPKCSSCHSIDGDDKAPKLKDAMHGKDPAGACYTCHLPKDAPKKLKCGDCHAK